MMGRYKPSNPRAAEIGAHLEDGDPGLVDVSFGWGTTVEFPGEVNLRNDARFDVILEVVKVLGLAAIAGRSEERFGFLGVRGTIRAAAAQPDRSARFFFPHAFPKTIHYAGYSSLP